MTLTCEWHWHMNDISDIYRELSSPQILTLHVHVSHKTPCLSYHTTDTSEFPVWFLSSLELVHNIRCWTLHCMWKLHQYSIWNCYLYLAHSPWNYFGSITSHPLCWLSWVICSWFYPGVLTEASCSPGRVELFHLPVCPNSPGNIKIKSAMNQKNKFYQKHYTLPIAVLKILINEYVVASW